MSHFLHLEREEGVPFGVEFVLRGVRERLTPIAMTALATSLVPLIVGGARPGHELKLPMAVVILGGLGASERVCHAERVAVDEPISSVHSVILSCETSRVGIKYILMKKSKTTITGKDVEEFQDYIKREYILVQPKLVNSNAQTAQAHNESTNIPGYGDAYRIEEEPNLKPVKTPILTSQVIVIDEFGSTVCSDERILEPSS